MIQSNFMNRIIVGDALRVLREIPSEIIDMGVTSPPYNKGENKKGWLVKNVKYKDSSDKVPEEAYQENQVAVLNELFRVTKSGGSFFYNHKVRWERGYMLHPMDWLRKTKWTIRQEIIWDRKIAANIRGWRFWQVEERIYWLYKPVDKHYIGQELKPKHALLTSIWRLPPENKNPHPAPFPIELPVRAIYSVMDNNKGIIIDPYCGSGTTLVASKLLGHDYIGIEISKEYADSAEIRLLNCENERKDTLSEIAKHIVTRTFFERKADGMYTGRHGVKYTPKEEPIPLKLFEPTANYDKQTKNKPTRKKKSDPDRRLELREEVLQRLKAHQASKKTSQV
ncbi:MAG: site-specific DNA-methyltransferase [Dehalococcoidales bacterium]|nr:site-specific DNA-methyltransferase [Dehalococcoidales bacterium]